MTANRSQSHSGVDSGRLLAVQIMLCSRIDELMDGLGVEMSRAGKRYVGPCPVHGGDNSGACSVYHEGDTVPGFWQCKTRNCERVFKPTIIGFVRGVLSNQKGWRSRNQPTVGFRDTLAWCCEFLGQDINSIKVDEDALEKTRFGGGVAVLTRRPKEGGLKLSREAVRARLVTPAPYFVNRGWSAEVLDRYDVGLCDDPSKPFHDRVIVPVFDDAGKVVVGWTARSVHEKCEKCKHWHAPAKGCPRSDSEMRLACKWRNSDNFDRESRLYNWWSAKDEVRDGGVVCVCEGPGDVWRLEEAGIRCGVGLFGNLITDEQQVRLEMSGAMTLISLLNNDTAGASGNADLKEKLSRCYRLVFPPLPKNDLGDMSPVEVAALVGPLINKFRRKF